MKYQTDKIAEDWRARNGYDRTTEALEGFQDTETLTLREYVESHLEEAVNRAECEARLEELEGLRSLPTALFNDGQGGGWINLPDDFMRLCGVRLTGWKRLVDREMSEAAESRQVSEFAGVRASINRPQCRVRRRAHGLTLEVFPADARSEVAEGCYLPRRRIENGAIEISRSLYDTILKRIESPKGLCASEV